MPVIGFLSSASADNWTSYVAAFREGLKEVGYAEGKNVAIEVRWANGRYDRLPALAADLVSREVAVIVSSGGAEPARAAKAATSRIPIVASMGSQPIEIRPGGKLRASRGQHHRHQHARHRNRGKTDGNVGVGSELAAPERGTGQGQVVIAMGNAGQDTINQVGQELTRRNLNVQLTLSIHAGFPVRVLVKQDLLLRPYGADAARPEVIEAGHVVHR